MTLDNVLVIFGGVSTEHLISRRSAYNIIKGLRSSGITVSTVGITTEGAWLRYTGPAEKILDGSWQKDAEAAAAVRETASFPLSPEDWLIQLAGSRPDCIFPAVHGINCEDGTLQGLLHLSGIPYTGCGVLASAAGMDKQHSKLVFEQTGIPQCRYKAVSRLEIESDSDSLAKQIKVEIGFPCFLKPNQGGSSVGTMRVDSEDELITALQEVAKYDRIVLVEEFVKAREVEAAVIGNDIPVAAPLGEVITAGSAAYYDYETKYFSDDGARIELPAALTKEQEEKIKTYALQAYSALGCKGYARVDFFLTHDDNEIYINEINTLPGFTPISIFPKAMAAAGMEIDRLVVRLCELAVEEHQSGSRQELI